MLFFKSIKNKIALTILFLFAVTSLFAQTSPAAANSGQPGTNQLAILLMILIVVLAFVIWGMGQVLTALGKQLVDKSKPSDKVLSIVLLLGFSLFSQISLAQDAVTTAVTESAPNYGGLTAAAYYSFLTVIGMELIVILFLAFSIRRMYSELLPEKIKPKTGQSKFTEWWTRMDSKLFTKAVPVEKEADVMLDHDYDGIRELDNALPPWWKYGFYITIGIAFIYVLNFHVFGTGLNPTEEYNAEMEQARIKKEIYDANNKDRIDENDVPMADADGIKAGQRLYDANCVACHLKDGGGSVGPNLTDDYWLHKGSLNDIYQTIKNGYPDKGMQSWSSTFSPKEMSFLASFIKTLHGTQPAVAKAQQGEFYVDGPVAVDSVSAAKPDSVSAAKPDSTANNK